jgi:hypothetical protein
MSNWSGIGSAVVGMERQGFVVSLPRLADDGWTASFHGHAMLAADEIGTAPTAFEPVHVGARRALGPQCVRRRALTDVEIDVL